MTQTQRFLLDADTFIQAKNRHYSFDICPGYWTALLRLQKARRVCSIDRVRTELAGYGDELSEWVERDVPAQFFKKTQDQTVIQQYTDIVRWVQAGRLEPAEILGTGEKRYLRADIERLCRLRGRAARRRAGEDWTCRRT